MEYIRRHATYDAATKELWLTSRFVFFVLRKEHVHIDDIHLVDAINRDAFGHDEIYVRFHVPNGGIVVSQYDQGFAKLVESLSDVFLGIDRWIDVSPEIPFTDATLILWERPADIETPGG